MPDFVRIGLWTIATGVCLFFAAPTFINPLLERYLVVEQTLEQADALVVMAGSPRERLPAVIRLYKEGRAQKILMANDGVLGAWSREHERNLYQVEWGEIKLLKQGIPPEAIVKLPFSISGTIHDAQHAMDFARNNGFRSLIVVTSDYHTRRTLWSFRQVVGDRSLALAVYPAARHEQYGNGFRRFYILAVEAMKNLYYRWKYTDTSLLHPA